MGLHVEVHAGRGPYLLLVHGILASRAQWMLNLEALAAVSRPVVVELLGHGRSAASQGDGGYRPEGYVAAFESIRTSLGVERWAICGQSLGAALTLRYALDHPQRVLAQVFTNSTSALADAAWVGFVRPAMQALAARLDAQGRAALAELPMHPRRARRLPPSVRDALVADCELHDPRGVARTGLWTVPNSPVRSRIAENRVPTLLVCGERESRFAAHREFARANMPDLEIVGADAGHAVNAEAADVFNAAVARFLRGAPAQ